MFNFLNFSKNKKKTQQSANVQKILIINSKSHDLPGQNVFNKIEKSGKTGYEKKSLIYTFTCFLTAITKV